MTVEIKDYHHPPSSVAASGMGNFVPPTTSSSSPSSPVLRNGGATSPDKSPRLRGAWGNLFHRGSMKKPRDSSKAAKIEARTRSEHELDGNGIDIGGTRMTSTQSSDLAGGRWRPAMTMPANTAQRLTRENGGDIRDGYGALMTTSGAAARGTLSEEDLVSKSLSRERDDVYKAIIPRGAATPGVQSAVPATLTTSTAYHSQDSVFDSPSRMPSYVRISCTLSGYRNYRNVDLKAAQSPRQVRTPPATISETAPDTTAHPEPISATPAIPIGKSIVERRLEKFQNQTNRPTDQKVTSPKEQQAAAMAAATTTTDGTGTPTPIKDLISNFNKMSIHDATSPLVSRPRQKPPPIPPKRGGLLDKFEQAEETTPSSLILEKELKDVDVMATMENGCRLPESVPNGVHDGNDAIFEPFPDSTTVERTVNGAFYREPFEEGVTTTVAQRAVDAAVEEAMKHVSASFIQSHQLQPQRGDESASFMSQQPTTTAVETNGLEITEETAYDAGKVEHAPTANATAPAAAAAVIETVGSEMTTVDGFYYQREAAKERERLEKLCAEVEVDLNNPDIPDEGKTSEGFI